MTWNYRVFKTRYRSTYSDGKTMKVKTFDEDYLTIRETFYYPDETIRSISAEDKGISAGSCSLQGLKNELQCMSDSVEKLVLTPRDIPGYTFSRGEIPIPDSEL